ncbi:MAG: CPBP family intramembrane glutamic endopeptidase [Cyanobacteria bacterium J06554_11]
MERPSESPPPLSSNKQPGELIDKQPNERPNQPTSKPSGDLSGEYSGEYSGDLAAKQSAGASARHSLNPFLTLQSRYLVLGTYLVASVVVGLGYAYLGQLELLPWRWEDPISMPVLSIAIWTVLVAVIVWASREHGLQLSHLFGLKIPRFSVFYAGLLVVSLLIFSMGCFSVVFYFLSLSFPNYAAQMLETDLMLGGGNSSLPQLYDVLMLFLLLVYAPLVEELVFRGILLQRWGTKWGLRWGLLWSSVLFGILHVNNPLGLTLFGLVMGLLYLRTRSLWVPVLCHGLNNLAAVGIDWLSDLTTAGSEEVVTVAAMQENWWVGLILIGIAAPFLMHFIWRSWPKPQDSIPYLANGTVS